MQFSFMIQDTKKIGDDLYSSKNDLIKLEFSSLTLVTYVRQWGQILVFYMASSMLDVHEYVVKKKSTYIAKDEQEISYRKTLRRKKKKDFLKCFKLFWLFFCDVYISVSIDTNFYEIFLEKKVNKIFTCIYISEKAYFHLDDIPSKAWTRFTYAYVDNGSVDEILLPRPMIGSPNFRCCHLMRNHID